MNITETKQYGPGVAALTTYLFTVGYMSVERIQKLLNNLRIPIGTFTVQNIVHCTALSTKETVKQHPIESD